MAKFLKVLCLALVLVMMFSMTTFAAGLSDPSVQADKDNDTVGVSGTVTDAEDNQQVVILVIKSTASLESVSDADIAYVDQISANDDGTYTIPTFGIDTEKMGERFTAYIGGTGVASPKSVSINLGNAGPGDCNQDTMVNIMDYDIVIGAFGTKAGDNSYDERADLEADSMINIKDYDIIIGNFGNSYK